MGGRALRLIAHLQSRLRPGEVKQEPSDYEHEFLFSSHYHESNIQHVLYKDIYLT